MRLGAQRREPGLWPLRGRSSDSVSLPSSLSKSSDEVPDSPTVRVACDPRWTPGTSLRPLRTENGEEKIRPRVVSPLQVQKVVLSESLPWSHRPLHSARRRGFSSRAILATLSAHLPATGPCDRPPSTRRAAAGAGSGRSYGDPGDDGCARCGDHPGQALPEGVSLGSATVRKPLRG
jgi:hypothetical protein